MIFIRMFISTIVFLMMTLMASSGNAKDAEKSLFTRQIVTNDFDAYFAYDKKRKTFCTVENARRWRTSFFQGKVIIVGDIKDVYPTKKKLRDIIKMLPNYIYSQCNRAGKYALFMEKIDYEIYARVNQPRSQSGSLNQIEFSNLIPVGKGVYAKSPASTPPGAKYRRDYYSYFLSHEYPFNNFYLTPNVLIDGLHAGHSTEQMLATKRQVLADREIAEKLASRQREEKRIAAAKQKAENDRRKAENKRRQARIRLAEEREREKALVAQEARDAKRTASAVTSIRSVKTWFGFKLGDDISVAESVMKSWISKNDLGNDFFTKAGIRRKQNRVRGIGETYQTCFHYKARLSKSHDGRQCIYHRNGRVVGVWQSVNQPSCSQRVTLKNLCWGYPNRIFNFYKGNTNAKLIDEDNKSSWGQGKWNEKYEMQNGYLHLRRAITTTYLQFDKRLAMTGGICVAPATLNIC